MIWSFVFFLKERLKTLKVDVEQKYVMLTYWQCLTDLCFDGRCLSFVVSLCCFFFFSGFLICHPVVRCSVF